LDNDLLWIRLLIISCDKFSIDLDLFSSINFDNEFIAHALEKQFKGFTYRSVNNPICLFGYIDDVKVDFVKHLHHPLINTPLVTEGIRFMSIPDIIAMKVNAVMKGGGKKGFLEYC